MFQQNLTSARDSNGHGAPTRVAENVYRSQDEEDSRKKALAVVPYGSEFMIRFFNLSSLQFHPEKSLNDLVQTALTFVEKQPNLTTQVHFMIEGPIPMGISIQRNQQNFSITLHVSPELKQELSPHMSALSQLLEQRLEQRKLDIQLSANPQHSSHGQGGRQSDQSQHSEEDTDDATSFGEMLKP